MNRLPALALALLLLHAAGSGALAKRMAPADVAPLKLDGVTYRAPHEHMGCIEALDDKTGNRLWLKQVYVVKYDPDLEKDVQDCFINALKAEGGKLVAANERGGRFELDLKTLDVKVLAGSAVVGK